MAQTITLDFSVRAQTSLGEEVYICGNIYELGAWDPSRALKLSTGKEVYPEWINRRSIFLAPYVNLQFKVFIKNSEGELRWEKIDANRQFLPVKAVIISFTQSRNQIIYEERRIRQEINIRKNTLDVGHDLSDEVSESSSGNQRQFWLERINKQRQDQSLSKQIVTEAKNVYDSWLLNQSKPFHHCINDWEQIVVPTHFIIRSEKCHILKKNTHVPSEHEKAIKTAHQIKISFDEAHENDLQNLVFMKSFPEQQIKIFHIYQDERTQNTIQDILNHNQGFLVVLLEKIDDSTNYLDNVQAIITKSKAVLRQCIDYFNHQKNSRIEMINQNQFLVRRQNMNHKIIFYFPSLFQKVINFQEDKQYFSSIQKCLLNHKLFRLPQNVRMCLLIENNVIKQSVKQKLSIVVHCDKLQQIPQKITTSLIRSSNCENVSVHIVVSQNQDVHKKFPISQKDRLFVYTKSGQVLRPQNKKKAWNLFDQLKLDKNKYSQIYNQLKQKIQFWVQQNEITINQSKNRNLIQFSCENNTINYLIIQYLYLQIQKQLKSSKLLYSVEKYQDKIKNIIILQIKPLINSCSFYSKLIASVCHSQICESYVAAFDYSDCRSQFLTKMEKNCVEKEIYYAGFLVSPSKSIKRGLAHHYFCQFLTQIINESYNCIPQDDVESMSRHSSKQNDSETVPSRKNSRNYTIF